MEALVKLKVLSIVLIMAGLVIFGTTWKAFAQTEQPPGSLGNLIDSSVALIGVIAAAMTSIGGLIGLFIPYLKGQAREKAMLVKQSLDQTDDWVARIEEMARKDKARAELLEGVVIKLAHLNQDTMKVYEEFKVKAAEEENKIINQLGNELVELDKGKIELAKILAK
jgi:hypothetical protein